MNICFITVLAICKPSSSENSLAARTLVEENQQKEFPKLPSSRKPTSFFVFLNYEWNLGYEIKAI